MNKPNISVFKNVSFSDLVHTLTMPTKASYWQHFTREGNKATCLIEGCKKPLVSLGKDPIPGEKPKRTGNCYYFHYQFNFAIWFSCLYSQIVSSLTITFNKMAYSGTFPITQHLRTHHPEAWAAYEEEKAQRLAAIKASKNEEVAKNEMDVSVRMFDIRTNGGRQAFLSQVIFI